MTERVLQVAIAAPLYRLFDYRLAAGLEAAVGCRVQVPFGRTRVVGVILALDVSSDLPAERLRPVERVLDRTPLLGADDLAFLRWVADYYRHPVGEVVAAALPRRLRKAAAMVPLGDAAWTLTASGAEWVETGSLRAPRQMELLAWLAKQPGQAATQAQLRAALGDVAQVLRAVRVKGLVEARESVVLRDPLPEMQNVPELNPQQAAVVDQLDAQLDGFSVVLLDGVTGSGKTEVYLQLVASVLALDRAVLVLVPEISLTPQLLGRFRERLGSTVRILHSGLNAREREQTWHRVSRGLSRVLLGTRSAIFTPIANLGLVVVDEEHDPSFKQTEGLRYSARDLAIVRARRARCPVLLGSATPSLESLRNAECGRYHRLRLEQRAGGACSPRIDLLDVRDQPLHSGLSEPLLDSVAAALAREEQVMLFLNRRGYAPVVSCFACGWLSDCPRCDARQTLHRASGLLWCHHCGTRRKLPVSCPACGVAGLQPLGQGTEQLEIFLAERFANVPIIRVDRDATARRGALEHQLARLRTSRSALLVGTQMLAKGHHFPRVTLVGVVDADGGLYSADFRATERMAQLLVQVAGRAGRGDLPGRVLIQTRFPDHPLLNTLVRRGYPGFAIEALRERRAAGLPPYSHQALVRAESARAEHAEKFLEQLAAWAGSGAVAGVELWGPVPAPMTRRAGQHRVHLLLQAGRREALHALLQGLPEFAVGLPGARRVRWSLDVDPVDLF